MKVKPCENCTTRMVPGFTETAKHEFVTYDCHNCGYHEEHKKLKEARNK
jgi:RNase P subunit RPR2